MNCLPKALYNLNPSLSLPKVLELFGNLRSDLQLTYVAYRLGMIFTPFKTSLIPVSEYDFIYRWHDGIICGDLDCGGYTMPHAVAKTPERLVDYDGKTFRGNLTETIFFAWIQ